jgi:hypothetical protein
MSSVGERQVMWQRKSKDSTRTRFGELELVDREISYIAYNRRDT